MQFDVVSILAGAVAGFCVALVLLVRDPSKPPQQSDRQMLERVSTSVQAIADAPYSAAAIQRARITASEVNAYLARTSSPE